MGNARLVNTIGSVAVEGIESENQGDTAAATEHYLATLHFTVNFSPRYILN